MVRKLLYGCAVLALLLTALLFVDVANGIPGAIGNVMLSFGATISLALSGYVVGLLEDIRDAVVDDSSE